MSPPSVGVPLSIPMLVGSFDFGTQVSGLYGDDDGKRDLAMDAIREQVPIHPFPVLTYKACHFPDE